MPVTESQKRAVATYRARNYEQIAINVKMGDRQPIKEHADKMGESLNSFIVRAINETMERDNNKK